MKKLIYILSLLILLILSCEKEQVNPVGYHLEFTHNGTEYRYDYVEHRYRGADLGGVTYYLTAANFFDDQGVAVSVLLGRKYPNEARFADILSDHTGAVDVTIEPDPEPGLFYFSTFFHRSLNGGYLERDGEQFVEINFVSASDVTGNCFDVAFTFELFANSAVPDCISQCENEFRAGKGKIRMCYNAD